MALEISRFFSDAGKANGHNPGLAELTSRLTGKALLHFPTAAVAHLSLTNEH